MITIFTPTYNRAYIIGGLYESLKKQTNKNFEWVVIDDGSDDNTQELFDRFKEEKKIDIKYLKVKNGGKQRAINRGADLAKGEYFFIVDSDDILTSNSVEEILFEIKNLPQEMTGLCFRRKYLNTEKIIGDEFPQKRFSSNHLELRYKYKVNGDKAEIYKTELLKENKFPEIIGENFVPESYLWNILAVKGPMKYIDKAIYECEYRDDGLTMNVKKNRVSNPIGFLISYTSLLKLEISKVEKLKIMLKILRIYWLISRVK